MSRLPNKFKLLKILKDAPLFKVAYLVLVVFALATIISSISSLFLETEKNTSSAIKPKGKKAPVYVNDQGLSFDEYSKIKKRNLFNASGEVPDEKDTGARSKKTNIAIPTRLPLKLQGILHTSDPKSGLVSLTLLTKHSTENYAVGDFLFKKELGAVLLTEIYPDKIVLINKGQKEFLELNPLARKKAITPSAAPKKQISGDSYEEDGFKRKGNDITVTEEYRQRLLTTEFAKILRDVRALPHRDSNNNIIGYRLTQLKPGSIFDKVGLKSNDIVTEINGVPLGNASQAIRYLNSLRSAEEVQMEVMRRGQRQEFNLRVQ